MNSDERRFNNQRPGMSEKWGQKNRPASLKIFLTFMFPTFFGLFSCSVFSALRSEMRVLEINDLRTLSQSVAVKKEGVNDER